MLQDILNSKWFLISLAIAGILIIVAALFRLLTPDEIAVPETAITSTNIDNSTSDFANIEFTGESISVPNSFTIAQAQLDQTKFQQSLTAIQQEYGLEPDPQNNNLWKNTTYTLLFSPTNNIYSLDKSSFPENLPTGFSDEATVEQTAQTIINQFFPNTSLAVLSGNLQYQAAGAHLEEAPPEEAAYVSIPFSYQVDGFPVFYQNRFQIPFSLLMDASQNVQQLRFSDQLLTISPLSDKNSITIAEAINNINTLNKGAIIVSLFTGYEKTSLSDITSGELATVSIEYRLDEQTSLLIPFYRFSGTLINADQTAIEAQVITPAVETSAI